MPLLLTEPVLFADPFKVCLTCHGWVDGVQDGRGRPANIPCGHRYYESVCPSWGPVDGCSCYDHLGYVDHPWRAPR